MLCVQLMQKDSKGKLSLPHNNFSQPPFKPQGRKNGTYGCEMSVIRQQYNDLTGQFKVYIFFPAGLIPKKSNVYLAFNVYGSSGAAVWWDTDKFITELTEVTKDILSQLQAKPVSFRTKDSCYISGILCWKSKQTPFSSETTLREALLPPSVLSPSDTSSVSLSSHSKEPHSSKHYSPELAQPTNLDKKKHSTSIGRSSILSELTKFESTIQQTASDLQSLRRENQILQTRNEQLVSRVAQLKTTNSEEHHSLQMSSLVLKIESLHQRIQALQADLSVKEGLELQHLQLQNAHAAQQKLIRLLEDKVDKYKKCSEVCRNQEVLISQLESLLAKQAEQHPSAKNDVIALLSKENAQFRAVLHQNQASKDKDQLQTAFLEKDLTIQSLKSRISQLMNRCQKLERHEFRDYGHDEEQEFDPRIFELEQKLAVAEAKLNAQTNQLQENAERWKSEREHYELQLATFRSQLDALCTKQELKTVAQAPRFSQPYW